MTTGPESPGGEKPQAGFEAWALPPGFDPPSTVTPSSGGGAFHLVCPAADPPWISRLAAHLRDAGARLRERSMADVVSVLGAVGERFLDPYDPLRGQALKWLPTTSGLSPAMASAVLDGMAADWTEERLVEALSMELGDPAVLDGFVDQGVRRVRAFGPELCFQTVAGSVPGVGVTALLRSLMVKSPVILKAGRGDVVLPVLMVRALGQVDASLAAACGVIYWPGGAVELDAAALREADCVVVYGGDDTVRALRDRTPVDTRFVAYHHRVSLALVGRDALARDRVARTAAEAAGAVAFFDQRGCVSPHVVYAEEGGETGPAVFAGLLADTLEKLERHLPSGTPEAGEAAALQQVRGTAEMLVATGSGMRIRHGGSAPWTVIYDPDPAFEASCLNRTVRVKPVTDGTEVPRLLAPLGRHLQTVGVAGMGERKERVAGLLGAAGAVRVTPLAHVPFPPPWWHHDGGRPLGALLRWVDWETR